MLQPDPKPWVPIYVGGRDLTEATTQNKNNLQLRNMDIESGEIWDFCKE